MSEEARWYVIHTYSGYEKKVASDIEKVVETRGMQDLIQEVKIPTETVIEIKNNKEKEVERKIFPGYVLVKMVLSDDTWYVVRNIRGCAGFVGASSKPTPLTSEEVEKMGIGSNSIQLPYSVGESVMINQGPLANMVGKVSEINELNKTVKVVVSMFGRETPAELSLTQVEPVM